MKKLFSVLLVALLMVGCGDEKSETPIDSNETKGGSSNVEPTEGKPFTVPDLSMKILWCPPGTFEMGSPESEENRSSKETQHEVTLTEGFWLGKHEVTQAQWEEVMGSNPSEYKGANLPVETVSWGDAISFCAKLTERERKAGRLPDGYAYQLPTEAQWEYACRAGTKTAFAFGDGLSSSQAKIKGRGTVPVGSYEANAWGFHDMHGNVYEWCHDWYGIYPSGPVRDPLGPLVGSLRVRRGGSWYFHGNLHRPDDLSNLVNSADRFKRIPDDKSPIQGFRVGLRWVQDSAD